MDHLLGIFAVVLLMVFVVWLLTPDGRKSAPSDREADRGIDPSDPRQIGFFIGLTGGEITDAAVAQYALRRFEEIHRRRATPLEVGLVVGLARSFKSDS